MVERGLVQEAKEFFDPRGDYTYGIRRGIGVPEMDEYFRNESLDDATRGKLLTAAMHHIKENTYKLASRQLQNIFKLREQLEGRVHRLDATEAFLKHGVEADKAWKRLVVGPSTKILHCFLSDEDQIVLESTAIMSPANGTRSSIPKWYFISYSIP
ncbi:7-deoxyloganetin glucosyltransferase [Handroanthus impetiginosus]|uniref:7-deoxyloganetin glucosyltransferase n=1 Tax=Handroanthus impetiginosus TaxID=429701 RepID=A0A2G9GLJ5_9LAMI|nr:7-deoxyloganetin glucosyltransferase [Handroanthus impetiginosus]